MSALIFSMSTSLDGFVNDRAGDFAWTEPDEELFRFHLAEVRELGAYLCGRRLYEDMLVWETDASLRSSEATAEFADVWAALPKVVFTRTLGAVQGNARIAAGSVQDEAAALRGSTGRNISIGGAHLAAAAIGIGIVDEFRIFRCPIVVGGGTPYFPPVTDNVRTELLETRTFASGVVYERHRRTAGTPPAT